MASGSPVKSFEKLSIKAECPLLFPGAALTQVLFWPGFTISQFRGGKTRLSKPSVTGDSITLAMVKVYFKVSLVGFWSPVPEILIGFEVSMTRLLSPGVPVNGSNNTVAVSPALII